MTNILKIIFLSENRGGGAGCAPLDPLLYQMVLFSMTPNPDLMRTPLFDTEYLTNDRTDIVTMEY